MSILNSTTPTANFGDYGDSLYRTKQFMYPNDLLSVDPNKNEYGGQYMMIYINVIDETEFKRADEQFSEIPNVSKRVGKELSGLKNLSSNLLKGGNVGTALIAGGIISGKIGSSVFGAGGKGATIGGAILGSLGLSNAGEFSKPRKRLLSAIALHIPNNLSINYGVTYGEADTAIQELALRGVDIASATLESLSKNPTTKGGGTTSNDIQSALTGIAQNLTGDTGKLIGKLTSLAVNPKKEQIFEGVPFRSFSYTYDFYPRSEDESENVKRILDELKYHMHPNFKDNAGFLFQYPAEFDIFFMHKGQENKFIHKHRSAVLESMAVNYSPNGQFSAFPNGSPTSYQATLNFKEVSIVTKEALESMGEVQQRGTNSPVRNFGGQADTF